MPCSAPDKFKALEKDWLDKAARSLGGAMKDCRDQELLKAMADHYMKQEEYVLAEEALRRVLALNARDLDGWRRLERLHALRGNVEKARIAAHHGRWPLRTISCELALLEAGLVIANSWHCAE